MICPPRSTSGRIPGHVLTGVGRRCLSSHPVVRETIGARQKCRANLSGLSRVVAYSISSPFVGYSRTRPRVDDDEMPLAPRRRPRGHSYCGQYTRIAAAKTIWASPRDNAGLFAIAAAVIVAGDCPAARPGHISRAPAVAAPASVMVIPSAVISDRNWASCSALDDPRDTGGGGATVTPERLDKLHGW
jgi:hypothetical protein